MADSHSFIEEVRVENEDRNSLLPMLNDIIHQNHPALKPLSVQQLGEYNGWKGGLDRSGLFWYRTYLVLWGVS